MYLQLIYIIQVTGTSLEVLYNGSSLTTATDSAIASGYGGIYNYNTGGVYDDFTIGNLGSSATSTRMALTGAGKAGN
jgi:hypothetical protein